MVQNIQDRYIHLFLRDELAKHTIQLAAAAKNVGVIEPN